MRLLIAAPRQGRKRRARRARPRPPAQRARPQRCAPRSAPIMARHALDPGPRAGVDGNAHARNLGTDLAGACRGRRRSTTRSGSTSAAPRRILGCHQAHAPPARTLLVVGHNPGLHDLALPADRLGRCRGARAAQRGTADLRPGRDRFRLRRLAQAASHAAAGWSVSSARARSRPRPIDSIDEAAPTRSDAWFRRAGEHALPPRRRGRCRTGRERDSAMYKSILVPIDLADAELAKPAIADRRDDGAVNPDGIDPADQRAAADAGDAGRIRAARFRGAAAQVGRGCAGDRGQGDRSRPRAYLRSCGRAASTRRFSKRRRRSAPTSSS